MSGRLSYEARRSRERYMRHINASTGGPVGDCWFTGMALSHKDYVWPEPRRPELNPLHDGQWFVDQGEQYARRATNPIVKACKYALVVIAICYLVSLANQYGALS